MRCTKVHTNASVNISLQFKLENNKKKIINEKQMCDSFANNNHFKLHTPELRQDPLQRSTDTVTYSFLIR